MGLVDPLLEQMGGQGHAVVDLCRVDQVRGDTVAAAVVVVQGAAHERFADHRAADALAERARRAGVGGDQGTRCTQAEGCGDGELAGLVRGDAVDLGTVHPQHREGVKGAEETG
jgi:hypothetical protein